MEPLEDVTVVIPTKDRPELLRRAVGSVLGQRGVDLRVVVVDDGSAVPAVQALPEDDRVTVVRHDVARGVHAARNRGLTGTTTTWVAFLDDDDVWGPHKLRRQLDALRGTECGWACSAAVSFLDDQLLDVAVPPDPATPQQALLGGNVVPGSASSVLVRTDLLRSVGGFDETLPSLEDWDLWIRLAHRSPMVGVEATDVGQRVERTSMSADLGRQREALRRMQVKHAAATPALAVVPDVHFLRYWARTELRSGSWRSGVRRSGALLARGQLRALLPVVAATLPDVLQRQLRSRRLRRRARSRPDQDWSWLAQHLVRPGGRR